MMSFISLFAGIGGFDLGLERAGMVSAAQVEIDAHCQRVQVAHFPNAERYSDVRRVGRDNLPAADLICGGFPCQDVSVAGKREGLAGERSGLWFEFHRVLSECRPEWVVVENVPGLLSSNGGRDFAAILRGLVELGYGVCWRILDAQYFGVAQRRRRVFVVGHLGDGRAAEVLFERESGPGDTAPSREAGQRTAYSLAASVRKTGDGHGNARNTDYIAFDTAQITSKANRTRVEPGLPASTLNQAGQMHVAYGGNNTSGPIELATALNAHGGTGRSDFESETFVAQTLNGHGKGKRNNADETLVVGAQGTSHGGSDDNSAQAHHLVTGFMPRRTNAGATAEQIPTQSAGNGGFQAPGVQGPFGVRHLTPVECERLQGFPDGWTAGQSDSVRYRQLGNAVCVNVAEWIGRRIVAVAP